MTNTPARKDSEMQPWTSFKTGIPDKDSIIEIQGYGLGQFVRHHENGSIDVYLGDRRTMTVPAETNWRRAGDRDE